MSSLPKPEDVDISIASLPCNPGRVPSLLDEISQIHNNGKDISADRHARLELLAKARALVQALETPRETMLKHCGAQTSCFFAIGLGVEIGLFKEMARDNGSPKTAAALAKAVGFDVNALRPILRHVAAMGYILETNSDNNEEEYQPNNFSLSLTLPIIGDPYPLYRTFCIPPMVNLHKWFKINNYQAPTSSRHNPFTFGQQTDLTAFEFLAANPSLANAFNNHMTGYRMGRPSWVDPSIYPVRERLLTDNTESSSSSSLSKPEVLLVDVGGNMGRDVKLFRNAFPETVVSGRVVLQDLPPIIEAGPQNDVEMQELRIEAMAHDFFTSQPVKGARAYYLHHILHDWPDETCEIIVHHLKAAMKPGHSRLLINEHIIPRAGSHWEVTYMDVYMMALYGARERTEAEWRDLLEGKCGLRISGIWNPENGVEGVIECVLPEV